MIITVVDVGNDGEIADVLHAVVLCHSIPFVGETGERWGSAYRALLG